MAGHRINGPEATRAERQHRKRLKHDQKMRDVKPSAL
jgi:hypothetical protein